MGKVILYELNEVPWAIIDLYLDERPTSNLATLLSRARSETTISKEPNHLSPWNTWPTFHRGIYADDHNSFYLGQDPTTFHGDNFWDIAEDAGLKVGLFGPLQSWPPREFRNGGFYVPDTFAQDARTHPRRLEPFQAFNLAMTSELGFSPDKALKKSEMVTAGLSLVKLGLTPSSVVKLVKQLARETKDHRYKGARSMFQVLPAFDLYWKLHRKERPDVSVFFTNHVAGMMHRFWGDYVPGYAEEFDYTKDDIYAQFVPESLDLFDSQLGKLMTFVDNTPDTTLVIASSMGQSAIPYRHVGATYVVQDPALLVAGLGIEGAAPALSMYPLYALACDTTAQASQAAEKLAAVVLEHDSEPLFGNLEVQGTSLLYSIQRVMGQDDEEELSNTVVVPTGDGGRRRLDIGDIGIEVARRMGGGNTGYHIPEGIYVTYGKDIEADTSRSAFEVVEAKGRMLEHLGLADRVP